MSEVIIRSIFPSTSLEKQIATWLTMKVLDWSKIICHLMRALLQVSPMKRRRLDVESIHQQRRIDLGISYSQNPDGHIHHQHSGWPVGTQRLIVLRCPRKASECLLRFLIRLNCPLKKWWCTLDLVTTSLPSTPAAPPRLSIIRRIPKPFQMTFYTKSNTLRHCSATDHQPLTWTLLVSRQLW